MDSMKYAGDAEATQVIGVSRRRDDTDLNADELAVVADQITVNVDKNKRPPCKKGVVEFHLDSNTGRIMSLDDMRGTQPERPMWSAPQTETWEPF
jgi:hypothetical protein